MNTNVYHQYLLGFRFSYSCMGSNFVLLYVMFYAHVTLVSLHDGFAKLGVLWLCTRRRRHVVSEFYSSCILTTTTNGFAALTAQQNTATTILCCCRSYQLESLCAVFLLGCNTFRVISSVSIVIYGLRVLVLRQMNLQDSSVPPVLQERTPSIAGRAFRCWSV